MTNETTRREFIVKAASFAGAVALSSLDSFGSDSPAISKLPKRVLGKTGVEIPILGLGADGMVTETLDPDKLLGYLEEVLDSGVIFFDTAYIYGKDGQSEKNLGLLMGTKRRKEAFLATKTSSRTYDSTMRQVDESLKRLRTDYLDLIQIHHFSDKDDAKMLGQKDGVLTALYKLRDQKVVRFIGLTGHSQDSQVKEALKLYEWDTFMCFVNPAKFSEPAIMEQIPLAVKQNAGIIAMKTFGGRPGSLVGNTPGKADARLLLRYTWSQPVTVAIPGVKSIKQFRENLSIAKKFEPMTPDEIQALTDRINSGSKPWQR